MARFSKRTEWTFGSNRLSEAVAAKKREGRAVLDLTESNPTRCSFRYLSAGLLRSFADPANLRYEPDPQGLRESREAVCKYYGEKGARVEPEEVFLTASTSEGYSHLFRLLADPGDAVAVPQPSYPLFDYLADLNDVRLLRYPLSRGEAWRLDLSAFEKVMREGPRAVLLVNPNNPTGNFIRAEERETVTRLAAKHGAAVISDEVFLDFPFDRAARPLTFAGGEGALTFTLSGVSKLLGLPQMKLGWIVVSGPADLKRQALERLEIIADTYLSANTPSQRALPAWLAQKDEALSEIRGRLDANRSFLHELLEAGGRAAALLPAEGGWYASLETGCSRTDEETALELLDKEGVLVHPGYLFDLEGGGNLVVSLLPAPAEFEEGAGRIARSLFF